ncbi:hypothetical protein BDD12DRAFT_327426 [Trichophaea hybrida]|nr:hypothetical protein BDD12DRAFT_327426 [Trichophaea hybrida]
MLGFRLHDHRKRPPFKSHSRSQSLNHDHNIVAVRGPFDDADSMDWLELVPGARVLPFPYAAVSNCTEVLFSPIMITERAMELLKELVEEGLTKTSLPLVFVGKGLGGIIVKQMLLIASRDTEYDWIRRNTCRLVFLGCPQRAADFDSWGLLLINAVITSTQTQDIFSKFRFHSPMPLMAISGAFYSIASTFAILSIYEQPQSKNVLIDKKSATLGLPSEEQIALEGTSTTYLKTILEKIKPPQPSELNQNYMDCLRTLTALSEDAQSPGDIWWHPATLTWLNDYPSYRSWLESRDPSVLHFHGKTGCGKSTALFYILDDLQTTFSSQISIVSFAFDRFDKRKNTTHAMLLSFARQLLLLQPSLFSPTTWPDGSDTNYTTGKLNKVLKAMLRCSTVISTTFLIDAVDECDGNPMGFLRDLVTLGRDAPEAVFKVIITSRSQQETLEWQGVTYLPVDLDNVEELTRDKVRVAEAGILALTQKQPALLRYKDTLISKLCSAKTTFLEIVLRLEQLGIPRFASTPTTILKELETPPRSPPQICEDILEHLSGENRLWALNALLWVFYAVRPLKPYELASALAIEETTGLCLESDVSLNIIGDLRQTLGSLLATRNGEFHFVHDSVRDYLDTHKTFQQRDMSIFSVAVLPIYHPNLMKMSCMWCITKTFPW